MVGCLADKVGDIRVIRWYTLQFGKLPKVGDVINNGKQNYKVLKRSYKTHKVTIECLSEVMGEVK